VVHRPDEDYLAAAPAAAAIVAVAACLAETLGRTSLIQLSIGIRLARSKLPRVFAPPAVSSLALRLLRARVGIRTRLARLRGF